MTFSNRRLTRHTAPYLAHRVDAGVNEGTSFASPRACADAASLKRPGNRFVSWASAQEVAKDIVSSQSTLSIGAWNARTGFGAIQ
jgi:hypothetical protein